MLKSTEKTFVVEIAPGLYRIARRGGRSAITGKFIIPKA